jgi:hypothetical protein
MLQSLVSYRIVHRLNAFLIYLYFVRFSTAESMVIRPTKIVSSPLMTSIDQAVRGSVSFYLLVLVVLVLTCRLRIHAFFTIVIGTHNRICKPRIVVTDWDRKSLSVFIVL